MNPWQGSRFRFSSEMPVINRRMTPHPCSRSSRPACRRRRGRFPYNFWHVQPIPEHTGKFQSADSVVRQFPPGFYQPSCTPPLFRTLSVPLFQQSGIPDRSERTLFKAISLAGLAYAGTILCFHAIDPFIYAFFLAPELIRAEKNIIVHSASFELLRGIFKSPPDIRSSRILLVLPVAASIQPVHLTIEPGKSGSMPWLLVQSHAGDAPSNSC
jgi:hypothetical protein